ncbi:hypothetical protein LZL87_013603 [Fusarium oxysporum]|nr:hypothetical protein LZL87_013603 [Fusarium oxysporum]
MGLSAKVKDILHSGESKDRSTADNTQHQPGSFPTKEMEPSETYEGYSKGYEHNKLHKADDPRGRTHGDNNAPRGHAHKDSGVGLAEHDPTSYTPSQEPISERRNDPLNRTTESTAAGGLGDTANLASKEGTSGTTAPSTSEHPHGEDIPSGGAHISIVGYGKPEDENARHRAVHSGTAQPTRTSGTLESSTFLHRHDRDQSSSNNNPHDAQQLTQENRNRETSDSNFNKGVAGAGAAGTAALGAQELNTRRHADETPTKADQTTEKTHSEEHKGRSFPLLGKHHKDHHKETKEDEHAKEPKKEHESKVGALFHRRGSKDKIETEARAEQETDKKIHSHSQAAPALGAAGAGGAYAVTRDRHDDKQPDSTTGTHQDPSATRGATEYPAVGLGSTKDYSTPGSQPTIGAIQQPYQQDSHRGTGLATGATAGLGAGALASHESSKRHDDDRYLSNDSSQPSATDTGSALGGTSASGFDSSKHEPFPGSRNQSHHSTHHSTLTENANAGKYNTLASGTPSGVKYDDDVDTNRSTQQAHVDTPQKKDNHYGAAAAGAGTAAAVSRNRDEKPVDKEHLTRQTEPRTERQLDRDTESHKPITGAVTPRLGVNKPFIHKCQKCGEDNDISQYFTSNATGDI